MIHRIEGLCFGGAQCGTLSGILDKKIRFG
jgi:hypothetical protein